MYDKKAVSSITQFTVLDYSQTIIAFRICLKPLKNEGFKRKFVTQKLYIYPSHENRAHKILGVNPE